MSIDFGMLDTFINTSDDRVAPAKISADATHLKYLYCLFLADILKHANPDNVCDIVTYQYGIDYNTSWRECPILRQKFMENYKHILRAYLTDRYIWIVDILIRNLPILLNEEYIPLGMDQAFMDSLIFNLGGALDDPALINAMYTSGLHYTEQQSQGRTLTYHGNILGLETIDSAICGAFNTYTHGRTGNGMVIRDGDKSNSASQMPASIGVSLAPIIDKVTGIYHKFNEKYAHQVNLQYWAHILSTLYRLAHPAAVTPRRLEAMYGEWMMMSPNPTAVSISRKFSGTTCEVVSWANIFMNKSTPELESLYQHRQASILKISATYPNSFEEKYLAVRYIYERSRRE